MPDFLSLRPITPDDEAFLLHVYANTREEELASVPWSAAEKEAFLAMQFNAQHRSYQENYPQASFQLILRDDRPIGRLYVDRRPDEICIVDIALLPSYRRQGIGSRLLKDLAAEADQAGKPLRIYVEKFNPALRLYERLGFAQIGDTGVYYQMERPVGA
jgi:ribosomal protein S18 acetylase RimI-like enzyme